MAVYGPVATELVLIEASQELMEETNTATWPYYIPICSLCGSMQLIYPCEQTTTDAAMYRCLRCGARMIPNYLLKPRRN